jgi:hypothetical protein
MANAKVIAMSPHACCKRDTQPVALQRETVPAPARASTRLGKMPAGPACAHAPPPLTEAMRRTRESRSIRQGDRQLVTTDPRSECRV